MKIYSKKGEFDLPKELALEIEKKNPFFNSVGEKSLPINLPSTARNKILLGVNSIDSAAKLAYKQDVIIDDGVTKLSARMIVHNISGAGISCTFYFGLSVFWELANETKIRSLLSSYQYRSSDLYADLLRSMDHAAEYDFATFEVATKISGDNYFVVNELDGETTTRVSFVGESSRVIEEDGANIQVPAGYGITCFIKVYKLLEIVFRELGYTFNDNFFSQTPFNQLVLLNNVIDLITIGYIKYEQLVPDLTVQELLDVFRLRFNIEFYVDELTKNAEIYTFYDDNRATIYLSKYAIGEKSFDFKEEFSKIAITITKNDDESTTEGTIIQDLTSKYQNIAIVNEEQFANWEAIKFYDCILRAAAAEFYAIEIDGSSANRLTRIGTIYYDYDTADEALELETIELKDEAVGMISVASKVMIYLGQVINLNTAIKDSEETSSDSEVPIKLCFAKTYTNGRLVKIGYSSISEYDIEGNQDINYSLALWGERGIFSNFYAKKDAFLRHSNYIVNSEMILPTSVINNISGVERFIIEGQEFVMDTLGYTFGINDISKCVFRTTRLYEPYDLQREQGQVVFLPPAQEIYYWVYRDNRLDLIPPAEENRYWIIEILGAPAAPDTPIPTPEQYEQGGIYYGGVIQANLVEYQSSIPVNTTPVSVQYWYEAERK